MSNLLHLTTDDFFIAKGAKGQILCSEVQGLCLVLFHAENGSCHHCDEAIPEFKKVARTIPSVKFGLTNLSRNPGLIEMSSKTVAPFEYVPYIILYYDGKPLARYEGERSSNDFGEFVQEMAMRIQATKKNFVNKPMKMESEVPVYGGIPFNIVCDEDRGICYLTASQVYGNKK